MLQKKRTYLIPKDKILLVDLLERVSELGLLVLHQVDGAVRPVRDELDHVEVLLTRSLGPEVLGAADRPTPAGLLGVRSGKKIQLTLSRNKV